MTLPSNQALEPTASAAGVTDEFALMIFFFFRGYGFLPIVFYVIAVFFVDRERDTATGYACLLTAAATFSVGLYFHSRPGRVLIDKMTGQHIEFRRKDSFMGIPLLYLGPIIAVLGLYLLKNPPDRPSPRAPIIRAPTPLAPAAVPSATVAPSPTPTAKRR